MNLPDPRGKIKIKKAILDYLYAPTALQRSRRLEELAIRNAVAGGFSHKSFVHKAEVYNADISPPPRLRNRLLPEFRPLLEEWLAEEAERTSTEEPLVANGLNRILNACSDARDVMKLLPESLHQPVRDNMMALVSDKRLSSDKIEALLMENAASIQRMLERMVLNLIL